jgi:hypothetical protein
MLPGRAETVLLHRRDSASTLTPLLPVQFPRTRLANVGEIVTHGISELVRPLFRARHPRTGVSGALRLG